MLANNIYCQSFVKIRLQTFLFILKVFNLPAFHQHKRQGQRVNPLIDPCPSHLVMSLESLTTKTHVCAPKLSS